MKIAFYTLGCKTNQFETQGMEQLFAEKGYEIVDFGSPAHAYIINTCTVTALGDKKSRIAASRARKLNPNGILAICGCYSQIKPEEVRQLCHADIVIGSDNKGQLVSLIEQALSGCDTASTSCSFSGNFEILPSGGLLGRTRAMLKVQDGCQNFCTYCLIPFARGACRSIPISAAEQEAEKLEKSGFCEIIITGIEISSYGIDLSPKCDLSQLVSSICSSAPNARIRLGSLEPRTVTTDFCSKISRFSNLCPHFHLSMQSGCDRILKLMNRHYTTEDFYNSCQIVRQVFPNCSITTDLIVGFPGETQQDFAQTLDFIEKCNFNDVHIFQYSKRDGTAASKMGGHLPKNIKAERAKLALSLCQNLKSAHLKAQIGTVKQVLFEHSDTQEFLGHSPDYFSVLVRGSHLQNTLRNVKISSCDSERLFGELV